ncbi:MAG: coproporphyrinogen III oxidase, partial [Geminicoccaceae bacterium]|nr:coproporphyrinogen III oxidase [Geminicoccaceae bacterium]
YARQDQDRAHWRRELTEALAMAVDHLSAYQLTIEPGTAFGARHARGGLKGLPDDDLSADMYLDTQEICAAAGMPTYEISNHARPGAESRHNLVYWRQGDWAAIGPGAHGRLSLPSGRWATEAHRAPGEWLAAVETRGNGDSLREALALSERAMEYLLMSMRLTEGMDVARYLAHGAELPQGRVTDLVGLGLVTQTSGRLAATATGRPVLNAILRELVD